VFFFVIAGILQEFFARFVAMKGRPEPMAQVNGNGNGYAASSTGAGEPKTPSYVAAQPKMSKQYSALGEILRHGQPTRIEAAYDEDKKLTWQQKFSMVCVAILWRINKYLKLFGFVVEWTLNLLNLNDGPFGFLKKLFLLKWGALAQSHTNLSLCKSMVLLNMV
jgi:hypothetical protein